MGKGYQYLVQFEGDSVDQAVWLAGSQIPDQRALENYNKQVCYSIVIVAPSN